VKVRARGLVFDVMVDGPEGAPPVLLLHGFPQNSRMWGAVSARLHAAGLRTIAPDQRGYSPGARPTEVKAYELSESVADAVAILDELGVDSAHVVGHDWGASVAWMLAGRHPDRVRTLTAISVPHPRAVSRALFTSVDQVRRMAYIPVFRWEGRAEALLLADDARRLRRIFDGSGLDPATVYRYVAPMLVPGALTAALNWYRALRLGGAAVGRIAVPTMYIWSDGDVAIGRAAARRCGDHVSAEYRFVQLPCVTHWIPDQVPGVVAAAVLERCGEAGKIWPTGG
jgi:pimeloyl-ACP methyl ester carboxylesterase